MAKRKPKKPATEPQKWYYTGPAYRRVKIEGIPVFDPHTIPQHRLAALMKRYPEKLGPYFTLSTRVKPGIETPAEEQQDTEESEPSTSDT